MKCKSFAKSQAKDGHPDTHCLKHQMTHCLKHQMNVAELDDEALRDDRKKWSQSMRRDRDKLATTSATEIAMPAARIHDPMTLIAGTWLAAGAVLYGLTPLPLHDATLGWTAAFWLLAAPTIVLLARGLINPRIVLAPARFHARRIHTVPPPARRVRRPSRTPTPTLKGQAATPFRLASIRRSNSRMMR